MNNPAVAAVRVVSAITALNVIVMSGFSLAALGTPQPALTFALYAAARTIPLAAFVLWAIYRQHVPALIILGALAGVIQLADAGVGLVQHDPEKTIGPVVIAILQFAALFYLRRSRQAAKA